jgi:hypothetical protein
MAAMVRGAQGGRGGGAGQTERRGASIRRPCCGGAHWRPRGAAERCRSPEIALLAPYADATLARKKGGAWHAPTCTKPADEVALFARCSQALRPAPTSGQARRGAPHPTGVAG